VRIHHEVTQRLAHRHYGSSSIGFPKNCSNAIRMEGCDLRAPDSGLALRRTQRADIYKNGGNLCTDSVRQELRFLKLRIQRGEYVNGPGIDQTFPLASDDIDGLFF
jgi:hypothetical protein